MLGGLFDGLRGYWGEIDIAFVEKRGGDGTRIVMVLFAMRCGMFICFTPRRSFGWWGR